MGGLRATGHWADTWAVHGLCAGRTLHSYRAAKCSWQWHRSHQKGFLLYVTLPVGKPMDLSAGALLHLCCWFWRSCLMGKASRMQPLARVFGVCAVPAFCFGNRENWCISLGTYERLLL